MERAIYIAHTYFPDGEYIRSDTFMKPGKKLILKFLPVLFCLVAMLLAACGPAQGPAGSNTGDTAKAPEDKQTLRYPVVGDIATLDPALVQDTDSNFPIQGIYTGLVTLDINLKVKPQLAASYKQSEDGLSWQFTLRDNLKFSDGSPLTAQDVVYSIDRVLDPAIKSPVSYYLSLIKGYSDRVGGKVKSLVGTSLVASDPKTVVITLTKPAAYFLQTLSYPTSYVVQKSLIDKYGPKFTDHLNEGGGAGPFKVESYSHSKGIELVRNDNYYGPKPQLKRLSVLFYKDEDGMYKAYQANQLEYTRLPPANLDKEKSSPQYRKTPRLTIRYLTMNYLAKPFDNIKIRQAFALAINKDQIVESALRNSMEATNHLIPRGMPGYYADLLGPQGVKSTQGDTAKAKQLFDEGMKEAGYANIAALPPLKLTFYPRNQDFRDAVTLVVQMWQNTLGVDVKVEVVSRAKQLELQTATKNNPKGLQIWQAGWNADYPDPQDWTSTFFSKGADYNQMNYGQNESSTASEQQAVQETLAKADVTKDEAERLKLYYEAEQKIVEHVGWIPIWQENIHSLTKPNVKNYVINAQDLVPPDDWSKIYIAQ
jgi:oligopeptide transport system substrate-binding protein